MHRPPSFMGASSLCPAVLPVAVRDQVRALAAGDRPVAAYLYDLAAARDRARRLRAALPSWAQVYYAVKANGFPPLLAALAGLVDGFEVSSSAEAVHAAGACRQGGVPARLVASGPAKNPRTLTALTGHDGLTVNVESMLELHRLAAVAERHGRRVPVALRVNPDRAPVTLPAGRGLRMGGVASPFGIAEAEVGAAVAAARALPGLDVIGLHVHAVSGNLDAEAHAAYVRWCLDRALGIAAAHGLGLRTVDVGGGLGVPFEGEPEFDLDRFAARLRQLSPPPGVRVLFEPGRWLVAPIGWYATEVVDVKRSRGECFVLVRGGINHFQLPVSWDIRHNFAVVATAEWPDDLPRPGARDAVVTVAGELCTPEDVLARDVTVPALRTGDVLVFPNAGAYGFEFAMPAFLGHPPADRIALRRVPG